MRYRLAGWAGAWLLRALGATWRIREEGRNPLDAASGGQGGPQIGALWHRDVLTTAWHYRDRGFSVAVSRSRDGDWICGVLASLGYALPARGSSSRGGAAALRQLVRTVLAGTTVSVLTDGPRGPALRSKTGVISLARLTGVAITPVAFSGRGGWRFGSWDRTHLPWPFARVVCRYGPPLSVPRDATPEQEEELAEELDRALHRLAAPPV